MGIPRPRTERRERPDRPMNRQCGMASPTHRCNFEMPKGTILPMSGRSTIRKTVLLTLLMFQVFALAADGLTCGPSCPTEWLPRSASTLQGVTSSLSGSSIRGLIPASPDRKYPDPSSCGLCASCLGSFVGPRPVCIAPGTQVRQLAALEIATLHEGPFLSLLKPPQN